MWASAPTTCRSPDRVGPCAYSSSVRPASSARTSSTCCRQNSSLAVLGIDLPEIDITDPAVGRARLRRLRSRLRHQLRRVDGGRRRGGERGARAAGERPRAPAASRRSAARRLPGWCTCRPTTCSTARRPTPYAEDATPDPRSAYGRTKLAGEVAVREVLPDAPLHRPHGVAVRLQRQQLRAGRCCDWRASATPSSVVDDQRGQPTYSRDLAEQIVQLFEKHPPAGTFHGTNSGEVTWFGFAQEIFRLAGADPGAGAAHDVGGVRAAAPRPSYSVLGHDRWEGWASRRCAPGRRRWPQRSPTGSPRAEPRSVRRPAAARRGPNG